MKNPPSAANPHDCLKANLSSKVATEAPLQGLCVQWPRPTEVWEVVDAASRVPRYARWSNNMSMTYFNYKKIIH